MKKTVVLVLITVLAIMILAEEIPATDKTVYEYYKIYYLSADETCSGLELGFGPGFTLEQKAIVLFTNLAESSPFPAGTRLLSAVIMDNCLILDFSAEIRSYGGGGARERQILRSCALTARCLEGINRLTVNVPGGLPEGILAEDRDILEIIGNYSSISRSELFENPRDQLRVSK